VALAGGEPGAPERHSLIQRDVDADLGGFADDDPHPMVDEEAFADDRRGVDLDPGHSARNRRDRTRDDRHTGAVQSMRHAVGEDRVHAWPGGEDLERPNPPGRRIAAVCGGNVTSNLSRGARKEAEPEHRQSVARAIARPIR
jgi:hypothetical protein